LLEDAVDGHGTQGLTFVAEGMTDIIDGQVLFAQSNKPLAKFVLVLAGLDFGGCWGEEVAFGVFPELVHEAAETAGGITEPGGGLGGGKSLDELGTESFVLAMADVFGLEEVVGEC